MKLILYLFLICFFTFFTFFTFHAFLLFHHAFKLMNNRTENNSITQMYSFHPAIVFDHIFLINCIHYIYIYTYNEDKIISVSEKK